MAALGCSSTQDPTKHVRVAAAADLGPALGEISAEFKQQTGLEVIADAGSTGLLAKQIEGGREVDLFLAADVSYVDRVVAKKACDGATQRLYGRGQLTMWSSPGGVAPPADVAGLIDDRYARIAIANPEHAPYGRAAREALMQAGIAIAVERRLVLADNVRLALEYGQRGEVDVAVVARSLALAHPHGQRVDVPQSAHAPLDQALVVCGKGAGARGGKRLADFILSPAGQAILARYGFAPPGIL